ncbi:MAG TPA: hypothetical protein VEB43_00595 [Anaeromyxobacter sp.]|nr:hypothetical protein [Anaeromyxobacter sp.]
MEDKPTLDEIDEAGAEVLGAEPAGGRGLIPDGVKKAILAGVGALFMTEEGARRLARDWKLPKEVIGFIGQQAQSAKDEVLRALSDEIRHFLESEVVRRELGRVLENMSVEIHAEIRLRRADDGSARPEVSATVRPRRRPARRKGKK